jgi:hypothetical protein
MGINDCFLPLFHKTAVKARAYAEKSGIVLLEIGGSDTLR